MSAELRVFIDREGNLAFVHDDDLVDALRGLGPARTRRASHVEPGADGTWSADLSPVCGRPVTLGPFASRRKALAAEAAWLDRFLADPHAALKEHGHVPLADADRHRPADDPGVPRGPGEP